MSLFKKFCVAAVVGSLGLVTGAANAATLITSITIKNTIPSYLQVSELQVFSGSVNVALASSGATATALSSYSATSTADKAIDGDTNSNYYGTNGIYHSLGAGSTEYLTVTLGGGGAMIDSLKIFGRTDCCNERDVFSYTLFNGTQIVGQGTLDARNASATAEASVAAVPEPASWAMMLAGFGMVGFGLRRRGGVRTTVSYA